MSEPPPADKRPTLGDMAAQNHTGGLECPLCGCKHWWTIRTRPSEGAILRRRECRHCGYRLTTYETA